MTQEEIREVNKRLYNKLPDVKNKEIIEQKKEELRIIADKKKIFGDVNNIYKTIIKLIET